MVIVIVATTARHSTTKRRAVNDNMEEVEEIQCSTRRQELRHEVIVWPRQSWFRLSCTFLICSCNIYYANNNTFTLSMKRLSYYILPIDFNSVFAPPPSADEFDLSQIHRRLPYRLDMAAHAR